MEKVKMDKFISKYNLGGSCESVIFNSTGDAITVKSITDDKNVMCQVDLKNTTFPTGNFGVYETNRLKSLLGTLLDTFSVDPIIKGEVTAGLLFSDEAKTDVTYVLSDEAVIPKVPDLKTLPSFELVVDLDEKFSNTFIKGKGALAEAQTFTVFSKDGETDIVIGFSTLNTNRIKIRVGTKKGKVNLGPISFSANFLKEILLANKEVKSGKMEISTKGLARVTFKSDDIDSTYYLVQIDTRD